MMILIRYGSGSGSGLGNQYFDFNQYGYLYRYQYDSRHRIEPRQLNSSSCHVEESLLGRAQHSGHAICVCRRSGISVSWRAQAQSER